jgi:hypothetical protein
MSEEGHQDAWMAIETAPEFENILVWFPWTGPEVDGAPAGFPFIAAQHMTDAGKLVWIDDDGREVGTDPTHWQPLPQPPEEGK